MDKLLTAKELSERLNLSISKLAIDRMKERGIPFIKWKGQGQRGAVRYSMTEVQAFMENNMKAKAQIKYPQMREELTMKIKFKKDKPVVRNTKVKDYICLNGKPLSEQTINDYAQFIPKWKDRIPLDKGDDVETTDCFLVSCVLPHNHLNGDDPNRSCVVEKDGRRKLKHGSRSLMISEGHTHNIVVHCRVCSKKDILSYFLSRLTGEVKADAVPISANQVLKSKTYTKDDFVGNEHLPMGMSKEKQWKVHQEIVAHRKKYENLKPWKQLSEEEKDEQVQEMIRQSRRSK